MTYYRKRRRARTGAVLILILALAVVLVSCVAGSNPLWIRGLFGTDIASYRAEPVIASHPLDGELAAELCDAVETLTSSSVHLKEFHTTSGALKLYRGELLNALVRKNYALYVGNTSLSSAVSQNYPFIDAAVMIPESDFENAAARYFGTSDISNKDASYFSYLSKAACYITPVQAQALTVTVTAEEITETQNTYRMIFTLTDDSGATASYEALFHKRAEGSPYLKALNEKT